MGRVKSLRLRLYDNLIQEWMERGYTYEEAKYEADMGIEDAEKAFWTEQRLDELKQR